MKNYLLMLSIAIVLLSGCTANTISGTYVKSVVGEYSTAHDTLVIANVADGSYSITRRTGYTVKGVLHHKTEVLTGTYDEGTHTLLETFKGHAYTLDPGQRTLTVGGKGIYRKL